MNKTVIGILAHVDAGKTTLSEAMLYLAGSIRSLGRVDNQDAFLDTYALERERGITIFSKQANLNIGNLEIALLDTPGHIDFSSEMERTLQVLDYAILVVSGADGVQGHTQTLWKLLKMYNIPTFIFVNKMDQPGTDKERLIIEMRERLDDACIDFGQAHKSALEEELAVTDETVLEDFLESGEIRSDVIGDLIVRRKVFPCYFGSALKLEGIDSFIAGLGQYIEPFLYPDEFGARVYKVSRDPQGTRLTYMKITGGCLKVKDRLSGRQGTWTEKINQIRIYSGEKYESVEHADAGTICAVTGLTEIRPGEGLGYDEAVVQPVLEPVLNYRVILPDDCEPALFLPRIKELEEEDPGLHIVWQPELGEIQVQLMGEVQVEILSSIIRERFDIDVEFDAGNIIYKETISRTVVGVGHFEPLKHYAEVHLVMEPLAAGSGLVFASSCSEDVLGGSWQRLILTHLAEKEHRGILTGSSITDMKITLAAGRAHNKHTEGGDFRQAAWRAVRQGLMQAGSVLLEPYYEFRLEVPDRSAGRAIADIERMQGSFKGPEFAGGMAVLTGKAPVALMQGYYKEVLAYTKGNGRIFCEPGGYRPCHNAEAVIAETGYDPERDIDHPVGSVFCSHGAGFHVPWNEVEKYMHIESQLVQAPLSGQTGVAGTRKQGQEVWLGTEEVDEIIDRTFNANKRQKARPRYRKKTVREYRAPVSGGYNKSEVKEEYLLVDGYNVIYAWEELRALADDNIDAARGRLMDILTNYQAIRKCTLIVVFDAYRVAGGKTKTQKYHNIYEVYTREAETADQYIERFAHENHKKYQVTVATSDGMEQMIIRGAGCSLVSARELKIEVDAASKQIQEEYIQGQSGEEKTYLL